MSDIFICGLGEVSPAGWGVPALREALDKGDPLPLQSLERPWGAKRLCRRAWSRTRRRARHSLLPATAPHEPHYAALLPRRWRRSGTCPEPGAPALAWDWSFRFRPAACTAAAASTTSRCGNRPLPARSCFPRRCSRRPEPRGQPAGKRTLVYTLVGDPSAFLQAVALGVRWLEEEQVDASSLSAPRRATGSLPTP